MTATETDHTSAIIVDGLDSGQRPETDELVWQMKDGKGWLVVERENGNSCAIGLNPDVVAWFEKNIAAVKTYRASRKAGQGSPQTS